ncbi:hypothetical protein Syun_003701 [Stephania yunnanensis]|uniref:Uncharacterized protein n=1 Tax=Stephania yunnanensis TaxID=152371 RepID=A0AAP0L436_9MAGN
MVHIYARGTSPPRNVYETKTFSICHFPFSNSPHFPTKTQVRIIGFHSKFNHS